MGLVEVQHFHVDDMRILPPEATQRGHDPKGIEAIQEGKCAVKCPTCPHPGINLPCGWKTKDALQGWIYALFITINANFRLKWKMELLDHTDPSLNKWVYFIEEESYKAYLRA
ncbi:hypothetical protein J3R82DRAFT_9413 [Butyriboletus roseoflavus]|nr:hypothetical protein J3R82DRAFT_9413 [Butyriboletus roseoflavus]